MQILLVPIVVMLVGCHPSIWCRRFSLHEVITLFFIIITKDKQCNENIYIKTLNYSSSSERQK